METLGFLFTFVLVTFFLRTYGEVLPISEECLGCICEAMTGCKETGCSETNCGIFFIQEAYWSDAGKPTIPNTSPNERDAFKVCALNNICAKRAVRNYMERYQVDCNDDGITGCYDYGLIHRYGAVGCINRKGPESPYEKKLNTCIELFSLR